MPGVIVHANRVNRMPQTLVRGRAVQANGTPAVGAKVEIAPFPSASSTRPDGSWLFYPGLDLPLVGSQLVTVKVTVEGRPPVTQAATLTLGQATELSTITV